MTTLYLHCKKCGVKLKFQMIDRGTCARCHASHLSAIWNAKQRLKENKKK